MAKIPVKDAVFQRGRSIPHLIWHQFSIQRIFVQQGAVHCILFGYGDAVLKLVARLVRQLVVYLAVL